MIATLGLGMLGVVLGGALASSTQRGEQTGAPAATAAAPSTPGTARVNNFKTGASVRIIACSEDGDQLAAFRQR